MNLWAITNQRKMLKSEELEASEQQFQLVYTTYFN